MEYMNSCLIDLNVMKFFCRKFEVIELSKVKFQRIRNRSIFSEEFHYSYLIKIFIYISGISLLTVQKDINSRSYLKGTQQVI